MAPRTLLEAVEDYPDIYKLAKKLEDKEYMQQHFGAIPDELGFDGKPTNEVTVVTILSPESRLEEAYRQAVRQAYRVIQWFGYRKDIDRAVVIAAPDPSVTDPSVILGSLVEKLAVLFCLDGLDLDWETKLKVMERIAWSDLKSPMQFQSLACIVDIDRVLHNRHTSALVNALKRHVVRKHNGKLVFYTSSDVFGEIRRMYSLSREFRLEIQRIHFHR
ncbi:hypothetical protein GGR55DRAFT_699746 [Xylaria sp. FL0064]|nr:hypothetical protein GGR55DRAFT_699746 [Xylaria sp. FL0064]